MAHQPVVSARRLLALAAITLTTAAVWIVLAPAAPLAQPLAFNHARHRQMACVTCHRGAASTARAGVPQGDLCVKCHTTPPDAEGARALWPDITRGDRIAWVQVTRVPEHVFFSHRRHVALGRLECTSCHGEMQQRTSPVGTAPVDLRMEACLSCHRREGASQDCAACHR